MDETRGAAERETAQYVLVPLALMHRVLERLARPDAEAEAIIGALTTAPVVEAHVGAEGEHAPLGFVAPEKKEGDDAGPSPEA